METFYKYIGCDDCQQQWTPYCPICKKKGIQWKDEDGRNVPRHQLTEKSKLILKNVKRNRVIIEDRIITPPPIKIKRKWKNKRLRPRTWESFYRGMSGDPNPLIYEGELPEMTDKQYSTWCRKSIFVFGVRMGPQVHENGNII